MQELQPTGTECARKGILSVATRSQRDHVPTAASLEEASSSRTRVANWVPTALGPRVTLAGMLAACLLWAYWPALTSVVNRWSENPMYSHGYLVPLFSAFLLWHRRDRLTAPSPAGRGWGLALIVLACCMSLVSAYLFYIWLDTIAFLVAVAALPLLVGGWPAFRWAWPSAAFLVFMLPLPFALEWGLAQPLQRIATVASTYVLQTIGLPALARGNMIRLDPLDASQTIDIAEACSGLGMLITFAAFSTACAILMPGGWGDRVVVLLSAAPIAIAANVARVVTTGVLYRYAGREWAFSVFHDRAGWLMMLLALALLWAECWMLRRLWLPAGPSGPVRFGLDGSEPAPTGQAKSVPEEKVNHVTI